MFCKTQIYIIKSLIALIESNRIFVLMKVRIEKTSDYYETARSFWKKHSFPPPHISFLPVNVFVVSRDGNDLYCCFFYHTDSALAWLAYPISNPEIPKEKRVGALNFLILEMEKYAKEKGYYLMFTTSPVKPVQDTLLSLGYNEGDVSVSHFFKNIY